MSIETFPADVESAALDLICRYPALREAGEADADMLTDLMQSLAPFLQLEGAFVGLSWPDACKVVNAMIAAFDTEDSPKFLRQLAKHARKGDEIIQWEDGSAAAGSLDTIADVLAMWL